MAIPILKQSDYLIALVESALSDTELLKLRDDLGYKIGKFRSKGVIVDIAGMDVVDSFASRMLRDIAYMIRLRGAETVVVGMQPDVAFTMVQLGISLDNVAIALDLEEGLEYLNQKTKFRPGRGAQH